MPICAGLSGLPCPRIKSLLCLDYIFQIQKFLQVLLSALQPEIAHLHKQHVPSFSPVILSCTNPLAPSISRTILLKVTSAPCLSESSRPFSALSGISPPLPLSWLGSQESRVQVPSLHRLLLFISLHLPDLISPGLQGSDLGPSLFFLFSRISSSLVTLMLCKS